MVAMAAVSCAALWRPDTLSALHDNVACKDMQAATSACAALSRGSAPMLRSPSFCSSCGCPSSPSLSSSLSGELMVKNLPHCFFKASSATTGRWKSSPLCGKVCASSTMGSGRSLLAAAAAAAAGGWRVSGWPPGNVSSSVRAPAAAGGRNVSVPAHHPPSISATISAMQAAPSQQSMAESDVMGLLLRERIVVLGHQIDDFVADAVISQLFLLDAQDPRRDIRFFINCPGGSINATMGIFDAMQWCRADISTIAMGIAASTAAIVLMGGTRGKRFAMPNTRIMMHQPLGGASGQVIDVEIQAKEIQYHKNNFVRLISEVTGRPADVVEKDIDRDRYMSPMEAVEYGLIDGVIDKDIIVPLVPMPENILPRPEYIQEYDRSLLYPKLRDDELF